MICSKQIDFQYLGTGYIDDHFQDALKFMKTFKSKKRAFNLIRAVMHCFDVAATLSQLISS